jgi:cytochrome c2
LLVRRVLLIVAAFVASALVLGCAFLAGYANRHAEKEPLELIRRLERLLPGRGRSRPVPPRHRRHADSIFVRLQVEQGPVPVDRDGRGGGLTSFGDEVLLLTHEGRIFSASSWRDIEELEVETPDNGLAGYQRVSRTERYREFTHRPDWLRYNDILHYRTGTGQGLALSYTEFDEENECYTTALAVLPLDSDVLSAEELSARREDWDVVYRTSPCLPLKRMSAAIEGHMAGGRIAFQEPGTLLLASGDYAWDGIYGPEKLAQAADNHYGKVMAVDLASRQARIVSIGHRNMQGIVVDGRGQPWVVEHGMRGGDELNRVVEGADYGWPAVTLGTKYNGLPHLADGTYGRHDGYTLPTFSWLPSVATSNITRIEGFHPSWDGDLLVSSLKTQSLFRVRIRDQRAIFSEQIQIGNRIRYAHQHTDGRLVLWTDERVLLFVTPSKRSAATTFVEAQLAKADYDDARRNRVQVALQDCMKCHSFERGVHANSPSLAGIFGAPIGATAFPRYSEGLSGRGGRWTREELTAFLADPGAFAPGTTMPDPGIEDPFVIQELVRLMEALAKAGPE